MYFGALPYKTKQFFFLIIKLSIVVGAFYFIYNRLINNAALDFREFIDFLIKNRIFSITNIIILLSLSCANWFFEIIKWQQLVKIVKHISFYDALKQSLAAQTTSLFTPNRIGAYAAKTAYYSKTFRKRILLLNLLGNGMQMLVTTILGVVGFALFYNKYQIDISFIRISRFMLVLFFAVGFTVFGATQKKYKIRGFSIDKVLEFIKKIPIKKHLIIFVLALVRYVIFSFQFYVLLNIFGVTASYFNAMIIITTMYLVSSIIPMISILDVVVKGSIAIYLFAIVGVNDLTILSISTLMWILNFVIPSVFGSLYVLKFDPNPTYKKTKAL